MPGHRKVPACRAVPTYVACERRVGLSRGSGAVLLGAVLLIEGTLDPEPASIEHVGVDHGRLRARRAAVLPNHTAEFERVRDLRIEKWTLPPRRDQTPERRLDVARRSSTLTMAVVCVRAVDAATAFAPVSQCSQAAATGAAPGFRFAGRNRRTTTPAAPSAMTVTTMVCQSSVTTGS